MGTAAELVVGIIECAAAAFTRVARQITGCTPTASYIDERTAVVEVGMVMAGSRKGHANPSICPFTLRQRLDRKEAAKSTVFLAALSQFSLAALSQSVTVNARPRPVRRQPDSDTD